MRKHIAVIQQRIWPSAPSGAKRIAALCALAAMAALVTFAGPGVSHAEHEPASRTGIEPRSAGSNEMAANDQDHIEKIWSANMKVGEASDSTQSYMGYLPTLNPPEGDLDVKKFSHNDVHYTIEGIFHQEFIGGFKQLVFNADAPLPDDLILRAGGQLFPLHDAADLGSGQNIHAWRLEAALDWSEGETIPLSLFKVVGSVKPSNPTDGGDAQEFMLAVHSMAGEIERSGQFETINVSLESGKRYVVEMKGAATGDGTLSDPWISGINGRFEVDGRPRWEPVWYDAAGRTSTLVQFPDGTQYRADENGRMFSASTGGDGSIVLRPVTGGNDDGGEGFNARLFLVNFPAGEYEIVVSGAPNPNDTGTYTFDLMEITSDDYSASPDNPGALTVGGSAVGNIEAPGDVDWFGVDLDAGVNYLIQIEGRFSGAGTLPDARFAGIYDGDATLIASTSNHLGSHRNLGNSSIEFLPASAGAYYVGVTSHSPYAPHRATPPVGTYTVSVSATE